MAMHIMIMSLLSHTREDIGPYCIGERWLGFVQYLSDIKTDYLRWIYDAGNRFAYSGRGYG